jgi:hypothetical protein
MMSGIFISYRRRDSIAIAGRIFDRLASYFGSGDVYIDIDTIPPGVDFFKHISGGMEQAKVVLALIGESWAGMQGPNRSRLHDPDDFVRIELELAFTRKIPVIPVLLGHNAMPSAADLPPSIADICQLNAAYIDLGRDFHPHLDRLIRDVERHLRPGGANVGQSLPGENSVELMERYFKQCDAFITVSPEHTLITQPKTELIGFRDLINLLFSIEKVDGKLRPLIWILDIGRQQFNDLDARMRFLNVQSLMARFKALKRFEDEGSDERWSWLQSRAVVVLLDIRSEARPGGPGRRPAFSAHNVSLTTLDSVWLDSDNFRDLYGDNLERVRQRTFNVFFSASSAWSAASEWGINELRYFGYEQFSSRQRRADFQTRGLELPPLPTNYMEAFRAVCAASAYALGLQNWSKQSFPDEDEATRQLRYLGYQTLRIDEFLETY